MIKGKYKYVVAGFLIVLHLSESQVISGCSQAIKGESCQLTCTTPDFHQDVFFKRKVEEAGYGCYSNGTCMAAHGYNVSQRSAGSIFETHMTLSPLTYRIDGDLWYCTYGDDRSLTFVTLLVHTIPSNVTITLDTTDPTPQIIHGIAACVYPNKVTIELVYQDGGEDYVLGQLTPSYEPLEPAGCESHEYQVSGSFQLTSDTIDNTLVGKAVRFKTRITVYGLSVYQESPLSNSIVYPVLGFGHGGSGKCLPYLGFMTLTGLSYLMIQIVHAH